MPAPLPIPKGILTPDRKIFFQNRVNLNGPLPDQSITEYGGLGCCHIWTGRCAHGYGQMKINGKTYYAHRIAWVLEHGEIPADQLVLHACDNGRCVNPEHLSLGDDQANNDDMKRRGRTRYRSGETWSNAKLSNHQVREIRQRRASGEGIRALAREFGMDSSNLSKIARGIAWANIT